MKKTASLIVALVSTLTVFAQIDSIKLSIESKVAVGSEGYLPFHIGFNEYGRLNPNTNDGFLQPSIYYPILDKKGWKIETGVDFVVKPVVDESFFHQAFFNIHFHDIELRFGKNAVNNDWYNDELGTGNLFRSRNARTITRVGGGVYKYSPVPFFRYLEVKGAVELGWLEDDRVVKDALYHEKFAYIKTAKLPINPFVGLSHNVLFGGTRPDGTQLPSNFWEAFFADQAVNSGNSSDSINAAGAHFGVFDLGFELPLERTKIKASFQQPISDASGYQTNFTSNKDFVLNLEMEFEDHPFLSNIVYEHINTHHQSGEGLPDPIINGRFYTTGQLVRLEDYDAFLLEQFGIETNNISKKDFIEIIRDETNFGYNWSGRDDHYNNGQYPLGNTFHRLVIGNPLFTTRDRIERTTGEDYEERLFIINNRIVGHHVGVGGSYGGIDFNLLLSWTYNYGTYRGKYSGNRFGWTLDRDYFFQNIVGMQYMGLDLKKVTEKLDYTASIGVDTGDYGNVFGLMLGVKYKIL